MIDAIIQLLFAINITRSPPVILKKIDDKIKQKTSESKKRSLDIVRRGEGGIHVLGEGGIPVLGEGGIPVLGEGGIHVLGEGDIPVLGEGGIPFGIIWMDFFSMLSISCM